MWEPEMPSSPGRKGQNTVQCKWYVQALSHTFPWGKQSLMSICHMLYTFTFMKLWIVASDLQVRKLRPSGVSFAQGNLVSGRIRFKPWSFCVLPAPLSLKARAASLTAGSLLDCWQMPLSYAAWEGDWASLSNKGNILSVPFGAFGLSALARPSNRASGEQLVSRYHK